MNMANPLYLFSNIRKLWNAAEISKRVTIFATLLSTGLTVLAVSFLSWNSIGIIKKLELKAGSRELNSIETLMNEKIATIGHLTESLAEWFSQELTIKKGVNNIKEFEHRISDNTSVLKFFFPGLKNIRVLSLGKATGFPVGSEFTFIAMSDNKAKPVSKALLGTAFNMSFSLQAAQMPYGEAYIGPLSVSKNQHGGQDDYTISIHAASVIPYPGTEEKFALVVVEIEAKELLKQASALLRDSKHFAIWSIGKPFKPSIGWIEDDNKKTTLLTFDKYDAGLETHQNNIKFFRTIYSTDKRPLLSISYEQEHKNTFANTDSLLLLIFTILIISSAMSVIFGNLIARPLNVMIRTARDVADGKKSIKELEELAKNEETNVLVEAIDTMRRKFDEREQMISKIALRFNFATKSAKIGIWEQEIGSDKELWNDALRENLTSQKGNFTPRLYEYIHDDDLAVFEDTLTETEFSNEHFKLEIRLRMLDGEFRAHQVIGRFRKDAISKNISITLTLIDIEEFKQIDRMKSAFLSTVSHEMRTPLTSINGSIGLLKAMLLGHENNKVKYFLDISAKNCKNLLAIIEDLLDLSKAEAGMLDMNFTKEPISECVQQAIDNCKSYLPEKEIQLKFKDNACGVELKFDNNRIQQVIRNLLSNAIKFSPEKSAITIVAEINEDGYLRVSVNDKGPGIPEDKISMLFDRFTQLDSSDSRQVGGTGLGLAISREIIIKHNGHIGFNNLNPGTQAYFDLPQKASSN